MKKFFLAVILFCSLASNAIDRTAFTFTGYDLNLRLEPEQQRLGVRGKITLRNDSGSPQTNLTMQISSSLAWRSIRRAGEALNFVSQPYTSDIDHTGGLSEAIVSLSEAVPPKGTLELEIGYEGTIALDATRLTRVGVPKELATHTDWDRIGAADTAVRGVGYVAWYPVSIEAANLSEGNGVFDAVQRWKLKSQGSNMRLDLCVHASREGNAPTALMNDSPQEREANRGECSAHQFAPLGLTVPTFAVGPYSVATGVSGDTRFFPEHKSEAEVVQSASDRVLPFVTERLGAPKRKVHVVELSDAKAAPFESGDMLLTPLTTDAYRAESTAVHQLTHAALPSPRLWIYEGLAHFAQALYAEHKSGRQAALAFMNDYRQQIVDREKAIVAEKDSNSAGDQSLINTTSEEFYRSKAMYVWWMLRDMAGDEVMNNVLTSYKADQDHEPSYVQQLFSRELKRDLEWFFDDWVYRDRGLPDFRIVSVYPRQTMRDTFLVTVTVENLGEAGAEVPVMAPYQGLEISERLEMKGKSQASVRLQMAASPDEATVNDGSVPETDFTNDTVKVAPAPK